MSIVEKKGQHPFPFESETCRQDKVGGECGRFAAGLVWPSGAKPGAVLVLGESKRDDPALGKGKKHYQVIDTAEPLTLGELIENTQDFQTRYFVDEMYADKSDAAAMEYLRKNRARLILREAPYSGTSDALSVYTRTIQDLLVPDRRRLFFGENEPLLSQLKGLDEQGVREGRAGGHGLVFALGYALCGFQKYAPIRQFEEEEMYPELLGDDGA
jgi:hypothetical protein